jgi:hypothetical protein
VGQGVIKAVAGDGSSFDIQIEKGYPTNLDDPKYFTSQIIGHLFDSDALVEKKCLWGHPRHKDPAFRGRHLPCVYEFSRGGARWAT